MFPGLLGYKAINVPAKDSRIGRNSPLVLEFILLIEENAKLR
jgi:hypothetical protein